MKQHSTLKDISIELLRVSLYIVKTVVLTRKYKYMYVHEKTFLKSQKLLRIQYEMEVEFRYSIEPC